MLLTFQALALPLYISIEKRIQKKQAVAMATISVTHLMQVQFLDFFFFFFLSILIAQKQIIIKFATYIAEQTHKLQSNSVQIWEKKKMLKLQNFTDLFTLPAFLSLLSMQNENYARLLVKLSNQFYNDKDDKKAQLLIIDKILEFIIFLKNSQIQMMVIKLMLAQQTKDSSFFVMILHLAITLSANF